MDIIYISIWECVHHWRTTIIFVLFSSVSSELIFFFFIIQQFSLRSFITCVSEIMVMDCLAKGKTWHTNAPVEGVTRNRFPIKQHCSVTQIPFWPNINKTGLSREIFPQNYYAGIALEINLYGKFSKVHFEIIDCVWTMYFLYIIKTNRINFILHGSLIAISHSVDNHHLQYKSSENEPNYWCPASIIQPFYSVPDRKYAVVG